MVLMTIKDQFVIIKKIRTPQIDLDLFSICFENTCTIRPTQSHTMNDTPRTNAALVPTGEATALAIELV